MNPLSVLTQLTPADWTALVAFLSAGGGVSVITKFITHFRAPKWLHPTAMARFVVTVASVLTAASQYILTNGGGNTTAGQLIRLITVHAAVILTIAHLWYWVTVNPTYKWLLSLLEDAAKWRAASAPQPTEAAAGAVQPGQIGV